jgi:hypothetical protein
MSIYKEASKQNLRVTTSKGSLNVEQLWTLTPAELDSLAVSLEQEHQASGKKSFLTARSVKDKTAKLRFDVVLDILNTKVEEAEEARQKSEDKLHNQKIIELIQKKQDGALESKSIKELEKMLR